MRLVSLLLTLILIIIGVAFAALNASSIEINYFIGTKSLPIVVVLLLSFLLGSLLTVLFLGLSLIKLKAKNTWLKRKLTHAQDELAELKIAPKQGETAAS